VEEFMRLSLQLGKQVLERKIAAFTVLNRTSAEHDEL
jgi:hypothetical protein